MDTKRPLSADSDGAIEGAEQSKASSFRSDNAKKPATKTASRDEYASIRQAILDEIDVGVIVIDPSTDWVVFSNRAAAKLAASRTGDPSDVTLFDHLRRSSLAAPSLGRSNNVQSLRLGNRVLGFSSYPLPDGRICYLVRDITEKHRVETLTEAIASTREISQICSSIRHELGNPISGVKMALNVLRESSDSLTEKMATDYLDQAVAEIARIESLLRSLKAFSMYENLRMERIGLAGFLVKLLALLRHQFEHHKVSISPRLAKDATHVWADPKALQQVMMNLFANAFDALDSQPKAKIEIQTFRRGQLVTIFLADNGCGIPEGQHNQVFTPFFTTKKSRTGLGLAIAKRLVTNMNGTITLESRPGEGTKISITLQEGKGPRSKDVSHPSVDQLD